jgi:hypothetical protein
MRIKGEKKMSNKITEVTNWKQLKEKDKIGKVTLMFPDGEPMVLKIKGLSQSVIDAINEKYEAMKPAEIYEMKPDRKGDIPKRVPITSGPDYEERQKKIKAIDSMKLAEMALAFLVVKPEGTLEEQIKQLSEDLLAGHFIQIIQAGYEVSGFKFDEKVEQAKNF